LRLLLVDHPGRDVAQKDGFQLCAQLRAAGANVPILMVTALDSLDQRVKGLDAGAVIISPSHSIIGSAVAVPLAPKD
jgi:DNA-binding response OmpR family regulator